MLHPPPRLLAPTVLALFLGGPAAAQTYVIESSKTRITFADDSQYGVRLESIETKQAVPNPPNTFAFLTEPAADGMMWTIDGILQYTGGEVFQAVPHAGNVQKSVDTSDPSKDVATFQWFGVPVPGAFANESDLVVTVRVTLEQDEELARWECEVKRTVDGLKRSSIETIACPRVQLALPITKTAEDLTELDAQARARLFIPSNFTLINRTPNWPLSLAFEDCSVMGAPLSFAAEHPNPPPTYRKPTFIPQGQVLQLSALYVADPNDPGYRQMFFAAAEDETGHVKRFNYEAVSTPVGDEHLLWEHHYIPSYVDRNGATDRWGNELVGWYGVRVGCLVARGDDYWYDALAHYRSMAESFPNPITGPKRIDNSTVSESFKGPAVLALYSRIADETSPHVPGLLASWLDLTRAYRDFFVRNGQPDPTFMHWQVYRRGQYWLPAEPGYPSYPVDDPASETAVDPTAPQVIQDAWDDGIRTSVYTEGLNVLEDAEYGWVLPNQAKLKNRGNQFVQTGNYTHIDFGRPKGQTWFSSDSSTSAHTPGMGYEVVQYTKAGGLYVDGVIGQGFHIGYSVPQDHPGHGGDYCTQGRRAFIDNVRTMIQQRMVPNDPEAFVMSEAAKEFQADTVDMLQPGYDGVPGTLALGEDDQLRRVCSDDIADRIKNHSTQVPVEAKTWSIPVWQTVYHEYSPASAPVMGITSYGMTSSVNVPGPDWRDIIAHAYAAYFVNGSKPAVVPYWYSPTNHSPILWNAGTQSFEQQQLTEDPSGYTYSALEFVKTLHEALSASFAGNYNLYGRAQRPLKHFWGDLTRVTNPTAAVFANTPPSEWFEDMHLKFPLQHNTYNGTYFEAMGEHEVPAVRSSVWKHEDEIGALLVNWTGVPANFKAVFDPALYDVPAGSQSYTATLLDENGPVGQPIQHPSLAEVHVIDATANGALGAVPAHTVWVVEFTFQ